MDWAAGEHKIVLYADDCRIVGRNPIWLQKTLMVMVKTFEILGLKTNLGETKEIMCTTVFIWGKLVVAVYKRRAAEEGGMFR